MVSKSDLPSSEIQKNTQNTSLKDKVEDIKNSDDSYMDTEPKKDKNSKRLCSLNISFIYFLISIVVVFISILIPICEVSSLCSASLIEMLSRRILYYKIQSGKVILHKKKSNYATGIYGVSVLSDREEGNMFSVDDDLYYISMIKRAEIRSNSQGLYTIHWLEDQKLVLKQSLNAPGLQLMTMHIFDGRLLVFNYYDGVVYQINDKKQLVPYLRTYEQSGDSLVPKQIHWAAIYGSKLYIGSSSISLNSTHNSLYSYIDPYVCIYDKRSKTVLYKDWTSVYDAICSLSVFRNVVLIFNTVLYSSAKSLWYFFPIAYDRKEYFEMIKQNSDSLPRPLSINLYITASEDLNKLTLHRILRDFNQGQRIQVTDAIFMDSEESAIIATCNSYKNTQTNEKTSRVILINLKTNTIIKESSIPGIHLYSGIGYNFGY